MGMFASVVKHAYKGEKKHFHVAIMPCTAKKFEANREEFAKDGVKNVDAVLSTQEIISMIFPMPSMLILSPLVMVS